MESPIESGWSRPVADPQAEAWLKSMQQFREHKVNQMLQKEAYGSLSEQDKLSFAREMERFRAAEEGIRKYMERSHK